MDTQRTIDKSITVLFGSKEYTATCEVHVRTDHNYGEDADGNWGIVKDFIDEIKILEIFDEDLKFIHPVAAPKGLIEVIEREAGEF